MSQVPVRFTSVQLAPFELSKLKEAPPEVQHAFRALQRQLDATLRYVESLSRIVAGEIDSGYPPLGAVGSNPEVDAVAGNLRGQWVSVDIDDPADLGTAITFEHNLGVPVLTNPGGGALPNVRWTSVCVLHGGRGGNGQPTAAGNASHTSLHFRLGDAVTEDSIDLRVHSDLTPAAGEPLTLDVRFVPAVG